MLETFDGSGRRDASKGWIEALGKQTRHEVRSPESHNGRATAPFARMSFPEVLQIVHLRESGLDPHTLSDPQRLNARLLCVLAACHEVDSARRRLMSSLNTLQTLQDVSHVLVARVEAGLSTPGEPLRLALMLADVRRSVEVATAMWEMAAPHFTRVTRLFPTQVEAALDGFVPMDPAEIERLALESAPRWSSPGAHTEPLAQNLGVHRLHLLDACSEERDRFVQARELYLQAVTDWELAQSMMVRARRTRELAESHFRVGTRSVLEFAEALVNEDRQRISLITRAAHASMKRYGLYAVALLLPEQFGCC